MDDTDCIDYLKTFYDDYVMTGAKTTAAAGVPYPWPQAVPSDIPKRGRDFVPRRIYIQPA